MINNQSRELQEYSNHEPFVSFEIAKMLKERGFDWPCMAKYTKSTTDYEFEILQGYPLKNDKLSAVNVYYAPTIQMALKWLRDVHKIHIGVTPYDIENGNVRYIPEIYTLPKSGHELDLMELNVFESYEKAVEIAIKESMRVFLEITNPQGIEWRHIKKGAHFVCINDWPDKFFTKDKVYYSFCDGVIKNNNGVGEIFVPEEVGNYFRFAKEDEIEKYYVERAKRKENDNQKI